MSGVEKEIESEWRNTKEHDIIEKKLWHDCGDIPCASRVAKDGTAFIVNLQWNGKFIVGNDSHTNPFQDILLLCWDLYNHVRRTHVVSLHVELKIRTKSISYLDAWYSCCEQQIADWSKDSCEICEVLRAIASAIQHVAAVEAASKQVYGGMLCYYIMKAHEFEVSCIDWVHCYL